MLSAIILVSFSLITHACISSHDYSQSYIIMNGGERVGKEIINEKTDRKGNLVCLSEQEMNPPGSKDKRRRTITTKIVFPKGQQFPVSYSQESSAGASYDVKVESGQIIRTYKMNGESRESKTPLTPDLLILNPTVFQTIDYWIRHYDFKKGGQQFYKTYLLPGGSVERLSIFPLETAIHKYKGNVIQLRNYRIEFREGLAMLIWVDRDKRLCRLFLEGSNIDVVRDDLFGQVSAQRDSKSKNP
ncbi:MAG: hypothetical protein JXA73_12540 [Acidobacteria bacterium]|nr:hypothetical protein [Acidobacteriota bacterium]